MGLADDLKRAMEQRDAAIRRAEEAERLAYMGDLRFPDLTWKARCAEVVSDMEHHKQHAQDLTEQMLAENRQHGEAFEDLRQRFHAKEEEVERLTKELAEVRAKAAMWQREAEQLQQMERDAYERGRADQRETGDGASTTRRG